MTETKPAIDKRRIARDRILADRTIWRALVDDVGPDRMELPGPMGDWTFKDLASHLGGWRIRRVVQLEAFARGEPEPADPWPPELEDDDSINAWIQAKDRNRSATDVVSDYDSSFERLAGALDTLPDDVVDDPDLLPWTEGAALLDADFGGHMREHVSDAREWLARLRGA